jgi:hypothetical protein
MISRFPRFSIIFPGTHEKGRRKKAESGKVRIKKSAKTFRLGMLAVFQIS